ncbi:18100_t:CDS:1 [Dentiscutata erythropus]|uniref:18100_t:CDS:1 n=2 Tax=Dentiscutata TaxID=756610 RepID=A0A9N9NN07_9GLOM|nr:18100_t:CDS:1 [Dentiscutata erythropus]
MHAHYYSFLTIHHNYNDSRKNKTVIYTIVTNGEIEDVPFTCPENYDYKSPNIRKACFVRSANLVCMWLFVGFATLWEISGCFGIVSKVEDLEYTFLEHEPEERAPLNV